MRVVNNIEFTSLDWTGRVTQAQKKTKQQLLFSPELRCAESHRPFELFANENCKL